MSLGGEEVMGPFVPLGGVGRGGGGPPSPLSSGGPWA